MVLAGRTSTGASTGGVRDHRARCRRYRDDLGVAAPSSRGAVQWAATGALTHVSSLEAALATVHRTVVDRDTAVERAGSGAQEDARRRARLPRPPRDESFAVRLAHDGRVQEPGDVALACSSRTGASRSSRKMGCVGLPMDPARSAACRALREAGWTATAMHQKPSNAEVSGWTRRSRS